MAEAGELVGGSAGGLSQSQEMALAALRGGQTFVRAAEEAGVTRMTLYRWLRGNAHFRAAFNAWQEEAVESARARLIKLADQAVDVVEEALGRSDEKVALEGAVQHRSNPQTRGPVGQSRSALAENGVA